MNTVPFEIPTLAAALEDGYEFTGRIKVVKEAVTEESYEEGSEEPVITIIEPAKLRYECEGCGCFCHPQELVDTSPFDGVPNDWMCGGCREKKCRDDFEAAKVNIPKPNQNDFATEEEFQAADEAYYKQLHEVRCNCARHFKQALLQSHNAPIEAVEMIGIVDKDINNRKMPPIAKAANPIQSTDSTVDLDIIDASGGIQTGKKARIGDEEAEVTEVNGSQVTLNRAAPIEHAEGAVAIFNLDEEEGV